MTSPHYVNGQPYDTGNLSRPPLKCADLHMHTTASDGVLPPEELVALAASRGIQAIAVTDHDTVAGVEEAQVAGETHGVRVLAGIELSVDADGLEVHMLGFGIDLAHEGLREHLAGFQRDRADRARAMIARLEQKEGVVLPWELVANEAGDAASVGRPHLAAALVRLGAVESVPEAFERYLRDDGAAFVPRRLPEASDAIGLLHEAGGKSVLAHPGHWTPPATLQALVEAGLDGIEAQHPSHDESLAAYYAREAERFGLFTTAGSDFHGRRSYESERLGTLWQSVALLDHLDG